MGESGVKLPKGVHKNHGKFNATAQYNGIRYYLGCFDTPEEAGKEYERFRALHPIKKNPEGKYKKWNGEKVD